MYPWTSTDHSLYVCTHTTRTMLSQGWVVREYNVSMDIHRSYIVRVYTHNKDYVYMYVIPWFGSSRIQCIHGHPRIIHRMCVHTRQGPCCPMVGYIVREYNVSMDIHGSFIVCVYTHNKDHVVQRLGSSRIQCIHGLPRIIHCMCVHTRQGPCCPMVGYIVREYNVSMDIHGSFIVRMYIHVHIHVSWLGSSRIQQ